MAAAAIAALSIGASVLRHSLPNAFRCGETQNRRLVAQIRLSFGAASAIGTNRRIMQFAQTIGDAKSAAAIAFEERGGLGPLPIDSTHPSGGGRRIAGDQRIVASAGTARCRSLGVRGSRNRRSTRRCSIHAASKETPTAGSGCMTW